MRSPPSGCWSASRDDVVQTTAGPVAVTVTIGGVTAPRHARNVDEVLARAQEALDSAKAKRRGSFLAYQPNRRARGAAPRECARHRRDHHRAQRAPHLPGLRAGGGDRDAPGGVLRMPDAGAPRRRQPARRPTRSCRLAERLGLVRLLDHRVLELVLERAGRRAGAARRASTSRPHRPPIRTGGRRSAPCCGASGRRRAADRRDHRDGGDPGHRRDARLRRAGEGPRLPHRHRRFRRRLHLVPQPAQARRRHRQDRRRVRAEHRALAKTTAPSCRR